MKSIEPTRKIKEEISSHFIRGGTEQNMPIHLQRVHPTVIASCKDFAQRRIKIKCHNANFTH